MFWSQTRIASSFVSLGDPLFPTLEFISKCAPRSTTMFLRCLEAFPVDDGWAGLVILLLADPHLLEGGEGSQDGASDPYGVFPLWWGDDLDLHGWWGKGGDLLLHPVGDSWEHGGTS